MEFKPNYKTNDNLFEIMLDKSTLTLEHPEARENWVSKDITSSAKIVVYNTKTKVLSQKSVYYSRTRGFYFKNSSKYWGSCSYSVKDLVPIAE